MKSIGKGLRYSFTIMAHPIRGFYEMRFEKQGNVVSCLILLVLMVASLIFQKQYTGFIFNSTNLKEFNILLEISNVVAPVLLWCIANWSITVLMDGEGRFVDIFMATCYATVPFTITTFIGVLMSRFLSINEQTFIGLVLGIGVAFTALLIFFGILTVHQFTVMKNIFSIILTIAGMAFIVFLILLFAGVFDEMFRYIAGVITEIQLRM
ncbi:MAG TPA: YIP1 family protein [Ruminococcaceae bacterium]|nr:YIP1 family protein [Oscillospiraceae bacterium]